MTLRLPDEVHDALRREAFDSRRSMNAVVLEALSNAIGYRPLSDEDKRLSNEDDADNHAYQGGSYSEHVDFTADMSRQEGSK